MVLVPCAVQYILGGYFVHSSFYLLTLYSHLAPPPTIIHYFVPSFCLFLFCYRYLFFIF